MSQKSKITQWKQTKNNKVKTENCYDEYCKIELDDHLYHSKDEMDAAVALLMLHYQDFQNIMPKNQILTPAISQKLYKRRKLDEPNTSNGITKTKQKIRSAPYEKHHIQTTPVIKNIKKKPIPFKRDINNANKKGTASLLTSCRNILKEFLEQNGFQ